MRDSLGGLAEKVPDNKRNREHRPMPALVISNGSVRRRRRRRPGCYRGGSSAAAWSARHSLTLTREKIDDDARHDDGANDAETGSRGRR